MQLTLKIIFSFFKKKIMKSPGLLSTKNFSNQPLKKIFYRLQSDLLFVTGKVSLPKNYFIKKSQINDIQQDLLPGDIAAIKHIYKLTNIAFHGDWSHGLLYLGSWKKLKWYFNRDKATNTYFKKICRSLGPAVLL